MQAAMLLCLAGFLCAAIAMLCGWPLVAVGVAYVAGCLSGLLIAFGLELFGRMIESEDN